MLCEKVVCKVAHFATHWTCGLHLVIFGKLTSPVKSSVAWQVEGLSALILPSLLYSRTHEMQARPLESYPCLMWIERLFLYRDWGRVQAWWVYFIYCVSAKWKGLLGLYKKWHNIYASCKAKPVERCTFSPLTGDWERGKSWSKMTATEICAIHDSWLSFCFARPTGSVRSWLQNCASVGGVTCKYWQRRLLVSAMSHDHGQYKYKFTSDSQ